ncbi:HAMP domain-containing sensor histidine kinase [Corynebacterium sp. HS2168-gen11]|uniref:sensor histidine kinase n=1 Tax=Corynebacterium sp. HS2168-gen11 TaxID=2974027 RepID=UPI00216AC950|nr:HAMP domain-containing sensor histidine kinase [Corynebacterium sp. HS2168-gen11]MCS4536394.1 HAMP domain-containing histidine kinase [Corynebacterium sp. HS2168-gen11]
MILRRPGRYRLQKSENAQDAVDDSVARWTEESSLRWRISMFTASMVGIAVTMMIVVVYWSVSATLIESTDANLRTRAVSLLARTEQASFFPRAKDELQYFHDTNPGVQVAIQLADWDYIVGDDLPVLPYKQGETEAVGTIDGLRIYMAIGEHEQKVIVASELAENANLTFALGIALLTFGGVGMLLAILTGFVVAGAGLRPLTQLQKALDKVAQTQELEPIPVRGSDELAHLTSSFNNMMHALKESRERQVQLVADVGHELNTPLTSMRTNIELLLMLQQQGAPALPIEEQQAIETDVLAQMEELSTLIGDLVELARADSDNIEFDLVDFTYVVRESLMRVQRRRPDVHFEVIDQPWFLYGDTRSLGRAVVNLMDNAAKWSPENGVVTIEMVEKNSTTLEFIVTDMGPGIPEDEREKVFDRFYRSITSRSMPGSGIGLAIVHQVITVKHGGTVVAEEPKNGGTRMRVTLPGARYFDDLESTMRPSADADGVDKQGRDQHWLTRWLK